MLIVPPDCELFLTSWLRQQLTSAGYSCTVGVREPDEATFPLATPHVTILDTGGGQQESLNTFGRSIGYTVIGGTRRNSQATRDLARYVYALVTSEELCLAPGSPFLAVDRTAGTVGPYNVADEADTTRVYMSIEYTVRGTRQEFPPNQQEEQPPAVGSGT